MKQKTNELAKLLTGSTQYLTQYNNDDKNPVFEVISENEFNKMKADPEYWSEDDLSVVYEVKITKILVINVEQTSELNIKEL